MPQLRRFLLQCSIVKGLPQILVARLDQLVESAEEISQLIVLESETYNNGFRSTYIAADSLMTVFIDNTERSPTFRLNPLDTVQLPERQCLLQVWTPFQDQSSAWDALLGQIWLEVLSPENPFYYSNDRNMFL